MAACRPVCLRACRRLHPKFPPIPPFHSTLPHSSHISSVWVFSFEQKKTARLSSLAFLFPFFSLLSSLRHCAQACAPRLIYQCYELWLSSVQVLAARNTAQRLEHIAFCCAFLFPFARGFIEALCLSAFDSRYRSWFGPPSFVARLLSPIHLATVRRR